MVVGLFASGLSQPVVPGGLAQAERALRDLDDRGTFILSAAGAAIGTETFEIHAASDKVEATAEIQLKVVQEGKALEFKTSPKLVLDSGLQPLTYTWSQKGPQSSRLEVDFSKPPARARYRTVSGEEDIREFGLPKDIVILDSNVIHHYQLVIDRYQQTKGGAQSFRAFIPQEALPGVVNVEEAGTETVKIGERSETLRHLVVTTELARIDLWADARQRLQRLLIPALQFEAVRK